MSLCGVNHVDTLLVKGFHPVGVDDKGKENDGDYDHKNDEPMCF